MIYQLTKPINTSGAICPLHKLPCAQVCHTCELWQPVEIPGLKDPITGEAVTHAWKCSFNWGVTTAFMQMFRIEGLGAEMEKMQKEFTRFRASMVALVGALAQVSHTALDGGQLMDALPSPQLQLELKDASGQQRN